LWKTHFSRLEDKKWTFFVQDFCPSILDGSIIIMISCLILST
jgi:hypothetical protein